MKIIAILGLLAILVVPSFAGNNPADKNLNKPLQLMEYAPSFVVDGKATTATYVPANGGETGTWHINCTGTGTCVEYDGNIKEGHIYMEDGTSIHFVNCTTYTEEEDPDDPETRSATINVDNTL